MNTTIRTLAQAVRNGEISSREILNDSLELAHQVQRDFNCFAEIAVTDARRQAERTDALVAAGTDPGRLAGVIVAIKDVTPVAGMGNRAGSPSQANVRATKDAVLVERLRGAGAVIIGKTTLPEHAYSSFCDSPLYGITRNPWNRDRTPGGSSGGSAVAVATGAVMLGEGTDMGGSIRIPAAFTGVVGIKPSFGRIPNDDMPSLFDDIQHHGLLARTVDDIALALECVSGAHPSDPQSGITPLPALDVRAPLDGMSIALSYDLDSFIVEEEITLRLREVVDVLAAAGARVEEVRTGLTREMRRGWIGHWHAYLAAHCADKTDERSDPRLRGHIETGLRLGAADLLRLDSLRAALWQALSNNVWQHHDLLLCPTMTHPAVSVDGDDEQYRAGGLDMTSVFNWAPWCPAISVPAGLSKDGLPIGIQLIARPYREDTLLAGAGAIERHYGVLVPPIGRANSHRDKEKL